MSSRPPAIDVLVAGTLAGAGALLCLALAPLWPPSLFAGPGPWPWLQSAAPPLASLGRGHATVLPPLAWAWPMYAATLRITPFLEPGEVVSRALAPLAAAWAAGVYVLLRGTGRTRPLAFVLSCLAAAGAGAGLFAGLPGADPVGALATLLLLLLTVASDRRPLPWFVVLPSAGLGLVTGPAAAVFAVLLVCRGPAWRALPTIAGAAAFAALLALPPVPPSVRDSLTASPPATPLRPAGLAAGGAPLASLVHPALGLVRDPEVPDWFRLTTGTGRGTLPSPADFVVHVILLSMAGAGLVAGGPRRLRVALALGLAGEAGWAAIGGFVHPAAALRSTPLLVVLIGWGVRDPARRARLAVLTGVVVLTAATSLERVVVLRAAARSASTAREQVLFEMARRPVDPWPRGVGHVLLAEPGSDDSDKAYREPGGSFSPAVGTFGVSLWVTDADGRPSFTSDTMPLAVITERLEHGSPARGLPAIVTKTPFYEATLRRLGPRHLALQATWAQNLPGHGTVVIRSVGPAGGPVRSLRWSSRLVVNGRWEVSARPAPLRVDLGDERRGWTAATAEVTQWSSDDGWGFARLTFATPEPFVLEVRDTLAAATPAPLPPARGDLHLELSDARFAASLLAQRDHLLMGLVGRETRPGDPTAYIAPWLRDGAYALVALAYAGELPIARVLAEEFAARDYFGGAGPEADSCGLGIWALEEVARRTADPAYDRLVWPHVRRKAECIESLLSARVPIHGTVDGPLLPGAGIDPNATLIAEAAQDGLIVGRMDGQPRVLYVNAGAWRGLQDAASLAERVGRADLAQRWHARAEGLQLAWCRALGRRRATNPRTFIASLWPTGIAAGCRGSYGDALERRWKRTRDPAGRPLGRPAWTYFDVAETHQWLRLGRVERVWASLEWFWDNQASPGLYTWWEGGEGAEGWGRWRFVRGWVRPPHITPHYWTAAEMALLQLEMLAYADDTPDGSVIVIGAAVPGAWLESPLLVKGISLRQGRLDWQWDGRRVKVVLGGAFSGDVRLGPAFPPGTPLEVERTAPPTAATER